MVLCLPQGRVLGSFRKSEELVEEVTGVEKLTYLWPIDEEEATREDDQGPGWQLQGRPQTACWCKYPDFPNSF